MKPAAANMMQCRIVAEQRQYFSSIKTTPKISWQCNKSFWALSAVFYRLSYLLLLLTVNVAARRSLCHCTVHQWQTSPDTRTSRSSRRWRKLSRTKNHRRQWTGVSAALYVAVHSCLSSERVFFEHEFVNFWVNIFFRTLQSSQAQGPINALLSAGYLGLTSSGGQHVKRGWGQKVEAEAKILASMLMWHRDLTYLVEVEVECCIISELPINDLCQHWNCLS